MELRTHTRRDHEIEQSSNDEEEICKTVKKETEKENNFRCDICGFVENSNESLTKHIAAHENQFKCVVCGTILKHKGNLILHMRIHVRTECIIMVIFFVQMILILVILFCVILDG